VGITERRNFRVDEFLVKCCVYMILVAFAQRGVL